MAEDTFSPLLISFFFPGRFYTITLGFAHLEVRNSFFFPQCEDKENSRFSLESQTPPLPSLRSAMQNQHGSGELMAGHGTIF